MTDPPEPITNLLIIDSILRENSAQQGKHSAYRAACRGLMLPCPRLNHSREPREMLETLKQDYIINAMAHGISMVRIVSLYALKNAMLPTMAIIGLRFGWMLGGTVLVETVFDWPGIGLYAGEQP